MTDFKIVQADVMEWCETYTGEPFHALLTDPPFHLTPNEGGLVECSSCGAKMACRYRYCHQCGGEMDMQAAKSGFMNVSWDGGLLVFQPELWQALARHLHPGAFILAFASGRGWHRLAVALEDAGMVYQPDVHVHGVGVVDCAPLIYNVCGQAFPKSTRIDKALDKRAGKLGEREVIGQKWADRYPNGPGGTGFHGGPGEYRQVGRGPEYETAPATPLARAWAGHRYGGQILRDLSLPIVVAQKPWTGNRLDCIVETGAGAMNVDAGRVATTEDCGRPKGPDGVCYGHYEQIVTQGHPSGRWPPNCAFTHFSRTLPSGEVWGCEPVTVPAPCPHCHGDGDGRAADPDCDVCGGSGVVEVGAVERVKGSAPQGKVGEWADGSASYCGGFKEKWPAQEYADANGQEQVTRYRCARHCAGCGCWWLSEMADACPECGEAGEWGCAVRRLGEDSGESKSRDGGKSGKTAIWNDAGTMSQVRRKAPNDQGTAARFFPNPDFSHEAAERQFWHSAAERLALGQTRKYAAKPSPREKSAGLERFVWRKRKSGHTRIWSDAAVDQFWHWQQEREGLPGEGFDEWLIKCGESKRKVHKIPYTWGNIHPTVKSISLTKWLSTLLLPPDIYAPRRLLIPFCGTFSEGAGALLAGWEHITGIDFDLQACWQSESRARFWTGWSAATGKTEVKPILKAAKKAQKQQGQTPEQPQAEQLTMEMLDGTE